MISISQYTLNNVRMTSSWLKGDIKLTPMKKIDLRIYFKKLQDSLAKYLEMLLEEYREPWSRKISGEKVIYFIFDPKNVALDFISYK